MSFHTPPPGVPVVAQRDAPVAVANNNNHSSNSSIAPPLAPSSSPLHQWAQAAPFTPAPASPSRVQPPVPFSPPFHSPVHAGLGRLRVASMEEEGMGLDYGSPLHSPIAGSPLHSPHAHAIRTRSAEDIPLGPVLSPPVVGSPMAPMFGGAVPDFMPHYPLMSLAPPIRSALEEALSVGLLQPHELDKRLLRTIAEVPEGVALESMAEFMRCDLKRIHNKTAFLMSLIHRAKGRARPVRRLSGDPSAFLSPLLRAELEGIVEEGDVDHRLCLALTDLPEEFALAVIRDFRQCDLSKIKNKTTYLMSLIHHSKLKWKDNQRRGPALSHTITNALEGMFSRGELQRHEVDQCLRDTWARLPHTVVLEVLATFQQMDTSKINNKTAYLMSLTHQHNSNGQRLGRDSREERDGEGGDGLVGGDRAVLAVLQSIQAEDHYPRFVEEEVDMQALLLMTDDDLACMIPLGPRKKLVQRIQQLRAEQCPGASVSAQA